MKITVKENREIIMINAKNTQNENDVEVLQLSIPEKYQDFNKKIVFITDDGVVWDLIEGDTYTLKRAITQYERVDFYIWLTKGDQDFRSVERTLILNKNHRVDGEVTPEEETDMERVISILESEITKVDNLNIDVNKVGSITTVTLTDKDGNEKSVEILDGKDGKDGKDGDGRDGFSPIITETQTVNGYDISITDKNGTNVISLLNGQNGIDGINGQDGQDGNDGQDGKDAKINGENILNILAGDNVTIDQEGTDLTINASGYDDTEIREDIDEINTNLNNYALITETGSQIILNISNVDYKMYAILKDKNNNTIYTSNIIDLPLETMVVNASYNDSTKKIVLTLQNGTTIEFSVADLVSGLVSETQLNTILSNYYTKLEINSLLNNKANTDDIPTKTSDLTNNSNFVSDSSYVHTDNNYSNLEKNKLSNTLLYESAQGDNITINNTAELEFKKLPLPMGNSTQISKNLAWIGWAEDFVSRIDDSSKASISIIDNRNCLTYAAGAGYQEYDTKYLFKINWKQNIQYTISFYIKTSAANATNFAIEYTDNSASVITTSVSANTWTYVSITSTANKTIKCLRANWATGNTTIDLNTFMVEEGIVATPYKPSNPSPNYPLAIKNVAGNVDVLISNKNLFNPTEFEANFVTGKIRNDSGQEINDSISKYSTYTIPVKANKKVYIYGWFQRIYLLDSNKNWVRRTGAINDSATNMLFTPEVDGYIQFQIQNNNYNTNKGQEQIEVNSVKTSYITHQEHNFIFPLGNEKLMLGDYLADDGIHHVRKQKILNGSETGWQEAFSGIEGVKNYSLPVSEMKTGNNGLGLSNYFINSYYNYSSGRVRFGWADTNVFFYVSENDFPTIESFKTWMSTHNVTIEYELAQEIVVPYTSSQQIAYNQIKQAISYEEQTNISGSSDGANPIFNVEAYLNTREILDEKGTYTKPSTGIPKTDLSSDVQTSLEKADTALQEHQDISGLQTKITSNNKLSSDLVDDTNNTNKFVTTSEKNIWNNKENPENKVIQIDSNSTDQQYPSAKCVYTNINNLNERINIIEQLAGNVYGIRRKITNNSSSEWERIYDSIGKSANATKDGTSVYNDFDNLSIWKDIKSCNYNITNNKINAWIGDANFKFDGSNGDVYTYIPETYWKIYQENDYDYILLADYEKEGFTKINSFFVGRYNGSLVSNVLHTYSGLIPLTNKTRAEVRNLTNNLGSNFSQLDWRYLVLQMLYLVEYANYNCQAMLGNGIHNRKSVTAIVGENNTNQIIVSSSSGFYVGQLIRIGTSDGGSQIANERTITAINPYSSGGTSGYALVFDGEIVNIAINNYVSSMGQKGGQCDSLGMKSGCLNNDGYHSVIYRGIENIFANIWQFVDGINIKNNTMYICKNHSQYVDDVFISPYSSLNYTNINTNGWVRKMGLDTNEPFFRFPIEVFGSSSTYMCDYYYQNTGDRIPFVGGDFNAGAGDGLWSWALNNNSSNRSWNTGCRIFIDGQ